MQVALARREAELTERTGRLSPVARVEAAWRRQSRVNADSPDLELCRLLAARRGSVRVADKNGSGILCDPARRYPAVCASSRGEKPDDEVMLTYAIFNGKLLTCRSTSGAHIDKIALLAYEAQILRGLTRQDEKDGKAECDLVGLLGKSKVLLAIEGKAKHGGGTDLGYAVVEAWTYCNVLQYLACEQPRPFQDQIVDCLKKHHEGRFDGKPIRRWPRYDDQRHVAFGVIAPRQYYVDQLARQEVVSHATSFLASHSEAFKGFFVLERAQVKDIVEPTDGGSRCEPKLRVGMSDVTLCGNWGELVHHLVKG